MLKKNISKPRVILLAILIFTMFFGVTPMMFAKASVTPGVVDNLVPPGCQMIDFEEGFEGGVILSTIEGLEFTTTAGQDWVYGDVRTDLGGYYYNARSLTEPVNHGDYVLNGFLFAWLGEAQGAGRIDFTEGTASYFSVLVSTFSGVEIDAYDSDDVWLDNSGRAGSDLGSHKFTRLTIEHEGMAYVIIHDTGNYWLMDNLVTDAPGVGGPIEATIDFEPESLNPKSMGKFVTVYIELPEGYDVNDIDNSTIELTYGVGSVSAEDKPTGIGDHDRDGIPDLMVKFNRTAIIAILAPGDIEITVSGESVDLNGDFFQFRGKNETRVLDFY